MSADEPDPALRAADTGRKYRAVVETYDSGPDECTIFPSVAGDSRDDDISSTWVSAKAPWFVDLAEHR
jgi:hypothetical protein